MQQHSLFDLHVGQSARIADLATAAELGRRLRSLGFLPGMPVTLTGRALFGLSMAVRILGSTVTLSRRNARKVLVVS